MALLLVVYMETGGTVAFGLSRNVTFFLQRALHASTVTVRSQSKEAQYIQSDLVCKEECSK
jgi:hypothetical protein